MIFADNPRKVRLDGVTLAFPNVFEPTSVQGSAARYNAVALFKPNSATHKEVVKAMQAAATEKWGEKAVGIYKSLKAGNRMCLHDGAEKPQTVGYEGNMYVNAAKAERPTVIGRDRRPLSAADGKIYSGAVVNVILEIWAQDDKNYGKRINAALLGVQFVEDGERLAGGAVASEDDFEALEDSADDFGDEGGNDGADPFDDDFS